MALDLQARDPSFAVIPVLLPEADPPLGFLSMNTWVELDVGSDAAMAVGVLAAAIQGEAPDSEQQERSNRAIASVSPYRGLRPFREEDAAFFFGREAFSELLMNAMDRSSFLAVVGSSGSGKSSVVRAGLSPSLRRNREVAWDVLDVVPGEDPRQAYDEIVALVARQTDLAGCRVEHDAPWMQSRSLPGQPDDGRWAERVSATVRAAGNRGELVGVPYGTDASTIATLGIPTVVFGPGSIDQAHTDDEWLAIDQLERATEVFYRLATGG